MSSPRLTQEQKNEIVAQYFGGVPTLDIAARFGVDRSYPSLLAKRYGVRMRTNVRIRARMSDSAKARHAD